jgi:hypothetical protein
LPEEVEEGAADGYDVEGGALVVEIASHADESHKADAERDQQRSDPGAKEDSGCSK